MREKIFQKSLECGAEVYLIMLGTNDANVSNWDRNLFRIAYKALVRKYTELRQKPLVFLMIPPACFEDPSSGISGFGVHPEYLGSRKLLFRHLLEPFPTGSEAGKIGRTAGGTHRGPRRLISAVMTNKAVPPVKRQGDVAVRAADRLSAGPAGDKIAHAPPVKEEHHLFLPLKRLLHPLIQGPG